jgi:putative ABC transport system permease protein
MSTAYTLAILWHERQRYLPAVLAVAFSALLVAVQSGLLLGMFSFASLPVDHAAGAHVWLGSPDLVSVDLGQTMPEMYLSRLASVRQVARCEPFVQSFTNWMRDDGCVELCMIVGSRLGDTALGAMRELTPALRVRLSEPGTIVVDESDLQKLGVQGVGDVGRINDRHVRVVGIVRGFRGMTGAYVFCSLDTARMLLRLGAEQATYVLGQCHDPADAAVVVRHLRARYPELSAFTSEELSLRSRVHWLTKTRAGLALGYAAALGLVVGSVVTSQTLYGATAASLREYAILRALGIPVRRMAGLVLSQSLWVGIAGILLAVPVIVGLWQAADWLGVTVLLPPWLMAITVVVTLAMAMLSAIFALRLLWTVEPITLLR